MKKIIIGVIIIIVLLLLSGIFLKTGLGYTVDGYATMPSGEKVGGYQCFGLIFDGRCILGIRNPLL